MDGKKGLPAFRQKWSASLPTVAYVDSFDGKFRDECLNDHYFTSLAYARAGVAAWRRDYNEARPHTAI